MLDDRKLGVLRAIVEDYVAMREPVGSRALVERHGQSGAATPAKRVKLRAPAIALSIFSGCFCARGSAMDSSRKRRSRLESRRCSKQARLLPH